MFLFFQRKMLFYIEIVDTDVTGSGTMTLIFLI